MKFGIDFDNTIVCYDRIFWKVATEKGFIPENTPVTKRAVRDTMREGGLEQDWIELQGYVYGDRVAEADLFPGLSDFLKRHPENRYSIISHKTKHPFAGPKYDLHQAASHFVSRHLSDCGIERVFFELTKEAKFKRIADEGCELFVDDLPEFLLDEGFPKGVRRVLFDPSRTHEAGEMDVIHSWEEMGQIV